MSHPFSGCLQTWLQAENGGCMGSCRQREHGHPEFMDTWPLEHLNCLNLQKHLWTCPRRARDGDPQHHAGLASHCRGFSAQDFFTNRIKSPINSFCFSAHWSDPEANSEYLMKINADNSKPLFFGLSRMNQIAKSLLLSHSSLTWKSLCRF